MAILAGICLSLVVAATAMAVDIGHQVFTERHLETIVDAAGIDASQALGDRRDAARNAYDVAYQFATESAVRNVFDYANSDAGNSIVIELGIADPATKVFTAFPPGSSSAVMATANAIRVIGTTKTNYGFMPGDPTSTASTVVMLLPKTNNGLNNYQTANAGMMLGSTLASFDSTRNAVLNTVLGGLLHGSVSVSAAGYNGLTNASMTLGRLWTELDLDVASTTDVMDSSITVRRLLEAEATLLRQNGDTASIAAADALVAMSSVTDSSLQFTFGDLLEIGTMQPGSVADASINALGFAGAAAEVANGTSALTMSLPVSIPGVGSGSMTMAVIQKPVYASGVVGLTAHTGQVRLQFNLNLSPNISVGGVSVPVTLPVYIEGGSATSTLSSLNCDVINTNSNIGMAASTTALKAYVGTVTSGAMSNANVVPTPASATLASVAGVVNITASGSLTVSGTSSNLAFTGPFASRSQHIGATSLNLRSLATSSTVTATGTLFASSVVSQVRTEMDTALAGLESSLLDPLGKIGMGLTIAGADVANPSADCLYEKIIDTD